MGFAACFAREGAELLDLGYGVRGCGGFHGWDLDLGENKIGRLAFDTPLTLTFILLFTWNGDHGTSRSLRMVGGFLVGNTEH
jgi:hypothetical protein